MLGVALGYTSMITILDVGLIIPFKKYPLIYKIPLMIGLLFRNSKKKYINQTHIEINNGRKLPFFESNLLGGSSVMNGCVHMLGSKVLWEKFIQKFNIKYSEVLRSYNNLYSTRSRDKGKIILSKIRKSLIDNLFFRTLEIKNFYEIDMNISDHEGFGPINVTANKYFRSSVISSIKKDRFKIFMNEKVKKIKLNEDGKVEKVLTEKNEYEGDYFILSGGVIGTCKILLDLRDDLKKKGKDIQSLEKVGDEIIK